LFYFLFVGDEKLDDLSIGLVSHGVLTESAGTLGILLGQDVALECVSTLDLSALGEIEALLCARMGFDLRHLYISSQKLFRRLFCGDKHQHMAAFELRCLFHNAVFGNRFKKAFHNAQSQLGMSHLASAESDRNLELVAFQKELGGLLDLGVEIADINVKRETYLFDLDDLLVFAGFLLALGLLKAVFAVIHYAANRRCSLRSDFYQVEIALGCESERLFGIHNSKLRAISTDHSDFLVPNVLVDEEFFNANVQAPPLPNKKWVQNLSFRTQIKTR